MLFYLDACSNVLLICVGSHLIKIALETVIRGSDRLDCTTSSPGDLCNHDIAPVDERDSLPLREGLGISPLHQQPRGVPHFLLTNGWVL